MGTGTGLIREITLALSKPHSFRLIFKENSVYLLAQ